MKKKNKVLLGIVLAVILATGCTTSNRQTNTGKLNITVSILPEKFFVERIGGDHVSVNVMVGPGADPHTYEPKPNQMAALSNSSVYFAIGVEFEGAWLNKFASANPQMKIVDLSAGINKIPETAYQVSGASSNQSTGELDPHIWTSPEIVKTIAQKIADELSSADQVNASYYQANLKTFIVDIENLQSEIQADLQNIKSRQFLVFHPAWGYFAREFNLKEIAVEIGGTEPSASELGTIIDTAKSDGIKVVFAQPEFSTQIANYIATEINGKVVLITPLAEDWMTNLRTVAQSFKENL
jgi:zinc transport system substrate-binding protein